MGPCFVVVNDGAVIVSCVCALGDYRIYVGLEEASIAEAHAFCELQSCLVAPKHAFPLLIQMLYCRSHDVLLHVEVPGLCSRGTDTSRLT